MSASRDIPWEALSRLLDDELDADEASALRARFAREPALAKAWADMQALPAELAALPALQVPAELDDAVLGAAALGAPSAVAPTPEALAPLPPAPRRTAPAPRSSRLLAMGIAGALVAAAALLMLRPRPTPELIVLDGAQLVDGELRVMAAGTLPIDVDGRALIRVEAAPPPRLPEGEDMALRELLAAAAGAAITVAVYEGTASYLPQDGGPPVALQAGEQVHLTAKGSAPQEARREVLRGALAEDEGPASVAEMAAELEKLRFENTLLRGQVQVEQGVWQEWPESTPEALREASFERALVDALGTQGELVALDCTEYPCIASIALADGYDREALEGSMRGLSEGLAEDAGVDRLGMMLGIAESQAEEGAPAQGFAVMAMLQSDDLEDPELSDRLRRREQDAFAAARDEQVDE